LFVQQRLLTKFFEGESCLTTDSALPSTPAYAAMYGVSLNLAAQMTLANRLPCSWVSGTIESYDPTSPLGMPAFALTRICSLRYSLNFLKTAEIPQPQPWPEDLDACRQTFNVPRLSYRRVSVAYHTLPCRKPLRGDFRTPPLLRSSRTLSMLKLVALRFCLPQPSDFIPWFSKTADRSSRKPLSLRDPPTALYVILPDAFVC